jgi:hypothetical protein
MMMRKWLRILAAMLALSFVGFWVFSGAHLGWTMTSVAIRKVDPVTELEYDVWEKKFVPGVDFLGAGLTVALGLFALTFLPGKIQPKP